MKLQLALDLVTSEEAVRLVGEVSEYIDIIEVGTPFIISEGMHAVRELRRAYPNKLLLADVKIMDGAVTEATYAFEAGADIVTVLAAAEDATVGQVVATARRYGRRTMADMIAVRDIRTRAAEVDALGADYICVHTAFDVQHTGKNPLSELQMLSEAVRDAKTAVAGGVKARTLPEIVRLDPGVIVVGGAITGAADRRAAAREIRGIMDAAMTAEGV